ncbi:MULTISPECIES: cell wall hydrolase [unclassified Sphingomonas]|uniref:cell wall hydrolase n=1 Tax=unclassified Sphingomonas TaxID=196159 RepID=UPI0025F7DE56|nr:MULTISPECIES: cell wall hydrolase [unclassified Sphingomonas]
MALAAALFAASSCVPPRGQATRVGQAVPPPTPRQLLRDLALDVPGDLPGLAGLPASLRAKVDDDAAPALAAAAPPFLAQMQSQSDAERATECLTAAVYYEARSESVDGQRAVAQVVLNRVRDRAFPHSVCGVVFQGSNRRTGCQFSFTCDGSMAYRRDPASWARAQLVAQAALAGSVYAPVGGATFYHTSAILPWWASSLARIGSVGAHIFYRWRGAMEGALSFRAAYAGVEPGAATFAPGDSAVQTAALYRDSSADGGVNVHRGKMTPVAASADAPTAVAVRPARMTMVSGVRVHLGAEAPRTIVTDGATIGEETDPT